MIVFSAALLPRYVQPCLFFQSFRSWYFPVISSHQPAVCRWNPCHSFWHSKLKYTITSWNWNCRTVIKLLSELKLHQVHYDHGCLLLLRQGAECPPLFITKLNRNGAKKRFFKWQGVVSFWTKLISSPSKGKLKRKNNFGISNGKVSNKVNK